MTQPELHNDPLWPRAGHWIAPVEKDGPPRVSDRTAFFLVNAERSGYLVEHGATNDMFFNPVRKETEDYISGRFG